MEKYAAIVLAAGKGTRMGDVNGSSIPKVMHQFAGAPIIDHCLDKIRKAGVNEIILVVGYKKEMVCEHFGDKVRYAIQEEQLGTGHAVLMAEKMIKDEPVEGVVVCYGDMPLFKPETINKLINLFEKEKPTIAMLTADLENPFNYGRIIRDENGNVLENIEEKDCDEEQKKIKETNPCFYIFQNGWLWENLKKLGTGNSQNEYYLTDLIKMANDQGGRVVALKVSEESEAIGINTQDQLKEAEEILRQRQNQ